MMPLNSLIDISKTYLRLGLFEIVALWCSGWHGHQTARGFLTEAFLGGGFRFYLDLVWILSGYYTFLPQSRCMHASLIGNAKLSVPLCWLCNRLATCKWWTLPFALWRQRQAADPPPWPRMERLFRKWTAGWIYGYENQRIFLESIPCPSRKTLFSPDPSCFILKWLLSFLRDKEN